MNVALKEIKQVILAKDFERIKREFNEDKNFFNTIVYFYATKDIDFLKELFGEQKYYKIKNILVAGVTFNLYPLDIAVQSSKIIDFSNGIGYKYFLKRLYSLKNLEENNIKRIEKNSSLSIDRFEQTKILDIKRKESLVEEEGDKWAIFTGYDVPVQLGNSKNICENFEEECLNPDILSETEILELSINNLEIGIDIHALQSNPISANNLFINKVISLFEKYVNYEILIDPFERKHFIKNITDVKNLDVSNNAYKLFDFETDKLERELEILNLTLKMEFQRKINNRILKTLPKIDSKMSNKTLTDMVFRNFIDRGSKVNLEDKCDIIYWTLNYGRKKKLNLNYIN